MGINLIISKTYNEKLLFLESDNIEIMIVDETEEIIKKHFTSLLKTYENI